MNIGRIFANAMARRVAYVVVALAFTAVASLLGIAEAHAQTAGCTYNGPLQATCQTREQAKAAADGMTHPTAEACLAGQGRTWSYVTERTNPTSKNYRRVIIYTNGGCGQSAGHRSPFGGASWNIECPAGQTWNDLLQICSECPAGEQTPTFPSMIGAYRCPTGQCAQLAVGCSATGPTPNHICWEVVGGAKCTGNESCPTGFNKDPTTGTCWPKEQCPPGHIEDENGECLPPQSCPEGQHKDQFGICKPNDSECPAGQVKSPEGNCLPGDGQCSQGYAKGRDGTCKKDSDGDGEPDEEEEEDCEGEDCEGESDGKGKGTFEGGDNCNAPPICSGDNIMCGQAKLQWRIECNTRKNAVIAGGQCNQVPQCTGDGCKALDYAILLTTWRTACALEARTGTGLPGEGGGLEDYLKGEREGERAALQGIVDQGDGLEGVEEGDHWATFEPGSFDENLFGGGSPMQCDFLGGPLQIMGRPIELPVELWSLFQWIGWITVASAYLWLAFKLGE